MAPAVRRLLLRSAALAVLACAAAWHLAGALFALPGAGASPAARATPSAAAPGPAGRGAAVARRAANEDDLPARRKIPKWEPPFPKYIVGSMLFFGIIGFFGGGPVLAMVFGISGAGFGSLFEPFQMEDGTISGLD
uniref:Uncharacterized protein n=1 Tax=Alexandrium monilatum TaxID=311494 RepID=A0A7S4WBP8_9DINO